MFETQFCIKYCFVPTYIPVQGSVTTVTRKNGTGSYDRQHYYNADQCSPESHGKVVHGVRKRPPDDSHENSKEV